MVYEVFAQHSELYAVNVISSKVCIGPQFLFMTLAVIAL